jgi:DNA-binding response OmpR family regulator
MKMTPLDKDGVLVPYQENFINLLLVEDKEQCRINFISKFRQMNFEVETFINCSEAQKRLDDKNQPGIDFLVIDADVVNGIDGISFARRHRDRFPILLISTKAESLDEVKEEGFVTLHKPHEDHLLANKINRAKHEFLESQTIKETKDGLENLKDVVFDIQGNLNSLVDTVSCHTEKTQQDLKDIKDMFVENRETQKVKEEQNKKLSLMELLRSPNLKNMVELIKVAFSTLRVFLIIIMLIVMMFASQNDKVKEIVQPYISGIISIGKP